MNEWAVNVAQRLGAEALVETLVELHQRETRLETHGDVQIALMALSRNDLVLIDRTLERKESARARLLKEAIRNALAHMDEQLPREEP